MRLLLSFALLFLVKAYSTGNIFGATDAPVYFPTDGPTTESPTTEGPTTTRAPPPTTKIPTKPTTTTAPGPVSNGPPCICHTDTVWIDVMILLDSSAATGQNGLEEIWSLVATSLDWFTIEKTGYTASNYTTRVGIISYAQDAVLYKPLGTVNNDDIDSIQGDQLPYFNQNVTNVEAALQRAIQEFEGPNHRPNARRVIALFAETYNAGGVNAPQSVAEQFKEGGGILIVFKYISAHGSDSTLQELASPGYYLSNADNQNDTYLDVNQAFCDANCFCANNYEPFTNSPRNTPTAGCYSPVPTTANFARSNQRCLQQNGYLASDQSQAKDSFLRSLVGGASIYIGLTWNSTSNSFQWADGSPVGSYQPWQAGAPPNGGCVFSSGQWIATDCRNGYDYVCEAFPCDSTHYCP